jgi:quinol monooxygenase YgiN
MDQRHCLPQRDESRLDGLPPAAPPPSLDSQLPNGHASDQAQLRHTEGLVGYALDADLVHAVFWTVSVWESQDALDRFARSDPHRRLISSIQPLMAPTTFTFWDQPSTEAPVQWDLAHQKLSQMHPDNAR